MKAIIKRLAIAVWPCIPVAVMAQQVRNLPAVDTDSVPSPANLATTPATTEGLSRDQLRADQSSSSDVGALLSEIAGVSARTGGGFSSMPAIRGLTEQRLSIFVDGHPIDSACPNDMNTPLSYTDPQTVASVSATTGVSPVSMGGDSIGGVITVNGPQPRFATTKGGLVAGEVSSFYRSNGDAFGSGLIATAATQNLSATYTGSYTQSGNYVAGGDLGTVHSSEYAKTDHALALSLQSDVGLFELKGGYHFSPYEGFVNQYMDMTSNKSRFVNGRYRGAFSWGTLDFKADYRATDHEMNFLIDKGGTAGGGMPMNTRVRSAGYSVKVEVPFAEIHALRVGNEFHHEGMNDWWPPVPMSMMMGPNTYININDGRRDRLGTFGEWEAHWSEGLSSLIGVREDRVSMNTGNVQPYSTDMMNMADAMAAMEFNAADHHKVDNNWSASALISHAPSDFVLLEIGYAHKVRSPNLYERYAWGRGAMSSSMIGWYGDGNGYVGNLDLKPERADTVSGSIILRDKSGDRFVKVSPFYTHVNDYIDASFLADMTDMMGMPNGFSQLMFSNQRAAFYGVDLAGAVPLWDGERIGALRVKGSLSYLHGENLESETPLYHQMPLNVKLNLVDRIGGFEAGLEGEWVAEKSRVDPLRHEPPTGSYALINLHTAYDWRALRLSFNIENLFDKAYGLPLGGVSLGDYDVSGGAVLRPVPGSGRSFNAGLSVRF